MSGESRDVWELLDDAIENTLYEHESFDHDSRCRCGASNNMDGDVLPAHRLGVMSEAVRAALRESLTVTTREQLDALPTYSVIRYRYKSAAGWELYQLWERLEGGWFCIAAPLNPPNQSFGTPELPALVLFRPDWETP